MPDLPLEEAPPCSRPATRPASRSCRSWRRRRPTSAWRASARARAASSTRSRSPARPASAPRWPTPSRDDRRARQGARPTCRSRSGSASRRPSRPREAADAGADGVIVGSRLVRAAAEAAGRPRPRSHDLVARVRRGPAIEFAPPWDSSSPPPSASSSGSSCGRWASKAIDAFMITVLLIARRRHRAHHRSATCRATATADGERLGRRRSIALHLRAPLGSRVLIGNAFLEEGILRVRSAGSFGLPGDRSCVRRRRLRRRQRQQQQQQWRWQQRPHVADHLFEPARCRATPDRSREAVVNGEKLALQEAGGKVGKYTIKYVSLDDATAAAGKWDPGQTSANARKAAQDKSTIAYLGEFNSGATAISLPILNEAGILQISPSNTYGRPDPLRGRRPRASPTSTTRPASAPTAASCPADHIQAAAQVTYQKDQGCTKTYILNDKEVYGKGIADAGRPRAKAQGLPDRRQRRHRHRRPPTSARWPQKMKSSGADCMFFGGITAEQGASSCSRTSTPPTRRIKLFGPDGVAESAFTTKLGSDGRRSRPTSPTRRWTRSCTRRPRRTSSRPTSRSSARTPEPYAIYGYEAMKVALLADPERRRQGQRPPGRHRRVLQDQGPRLGPGQVLDRRERRHDALRLRRGYASRTASSCSTRSSRPRRRASTMT